jgi:hypothetical protein
MLVRRFGNGMLAVVGPEPVEGPWVIGPLVGGETEFGYDVFEWQFWAGPDVRAVRIETYAEPVPGPPLSTGRALWACNGHDGPTSPATLPVTIDQVPHCFAGESAEGDLAVMQSVSGTTILVVLEDWPLDQALSLATREGAELDALLTGGQEVPDRVQAAREGRTSEGFGWASVPD